MDSTLESHEQAVISVLCFLLGFPDNFKYTNTLRNTAYLNMLLIVNC